MRKATALSLVGFLVLATSGGAIVRGAVERPAACAVGGAAAPHAPLTDTPCVDGFAGPYPCRNVDLRSHVSLTTMECETGNSLWGWTDPLDAREYALMGCDNGISFVDITDSDAPVYLGRLPTFEHEHLGDSPDHEGDSLWRDVRVYANHAFVVSEQPEHHMQVFDLTRLRSIVSPPVEFVEDALYEGIATTHTIAINESTGFAFLAGTNTCNGGLHMVNIQDPLEPAFAGCVSEDDYTHETQCTIYNGPDADYAGREVCFSSNVDTLTIVDVTDKSDPVQISRTGYDTAGYTHQGWLTEDQRYFLLNDELDECDQGHNSWTYIWDLADLDAPVLMGHYVGATTAIDHNLYIRDDYVYESNYRAGLRILDATGVEAAWLFEVAYFDIYPEDNAPDFNANWNNYPFFPSGNVILSGIEQGLFVVTPHLDPNPTSIVVNDATVTEGDSGEVLASFTVRLTRAVPDTVTVHYQTGFGTASPGIDYEPASGDLTFDPDETAQVVDVTVYGDTSSEGDETFRLSLSGAVNARLADSAGTGRIVDDDAQPTLSISDAVVSEGDGPGTTASFTVSLSEASGQTVSALFATSHGTAGAGDYTTTNVAVELPAGTTSTVVLVPVTGDERDENDESFQVTLSSVSHATLVDGEATGTIQDDDTLLVSAVGPASGPASGGLEITVSGESFEAGAAVTMGGVAATDVAFTGPGQLTATTPELAPGTANDVVVSITGLTPATLPAGFFADFLDVDGSHPFHEFVVGVAKAGVTAGCGGGDYCPGESVTRDQMAVFLLKAKHGSDYTPAECTGIFSDTPCPGPFTDWIEQLAAEGVTSGCGTGVYCPNAPVTRAQMAVFLLKAKEGSAYVPPAAAGLFGDVPISDPFAPWIEDLYGREITGGCNASPLLYCPGSANNRGQMAVFVVKTFGL
jgi:choice-of-anchor B domain-containing protein